MVKCGSWPVGVCSWSLRKDVAGVAKAMSKIGVEHVHLAVHPALQQNGRPYLAAVRRQSWTITATMIDFPHEDYSTLESIRLTGGIAPDEYWQQGRTFFAEAVDITARLSVPYLSMHAGFVDLSQAGYARKFYERVGQLADKAQRSNVMLLLETGQESADELVEFLEILDHPAVGVNFDPANVILYDKGDPAEALRVLAPWIKHVHIKDAVRTREPGTWGTEVPWGQGQVGGNGFLRVLKEVGFAGALAVEREAGDNRFADIRLAVESLGKFEG